MIFAVPSPYCSLEYVDFIAFLNTECNNSSKIDEIYLSPPMSSTLHVRYIDNKNIGWDEFANFVAYAKQNDLAINAILNAPYINVEENKIIEHLNIIADCGVKYITVSNPYLLHLINKEKINLLTILSTVSGINSKESFKQWNAFKPSRIVLNCDLNRNISELKSIIELAETELEIIVNLDCIRECSLSSFHYIYSSCKQKYGTKNIYRDFCSRIRLSNLVEYVKSPWILPEHCHFYHEIGIKKFKIAGRNFPFPELKKLITYYLLGKSPDNLSNLFRPERKLAFRNGDKELFVKLKREEFIKEEFIKHFLSGKCNLKCANCNFCNNYLQGIELSGDLSLSELINSLS